MLNRADPIKTALTVTLLAIVFTLSLDSDFYNYSMMDAFMAMALAGSLVTLLVIEPSWRNVGGTALGGLVLAGLDYRVMRFQARFMAAFSFVGLSALAVMGLRAIWAHSSDGEQESGGARRADRRMFLYAFLPSVLFVA